MQRVAAPDVLREGWKRVRVKRAAGGIDAVSVDAFAKRAEAELECLRIELLEERYIPEPVKSFTIPKESGSGERRPLGMACIRDKVVQHAVRAVLEPRCESRFLDCSYGYRPNKGAVRAIARVTDYLAHRHCQWVATADIDNFFGSLDHDLLLKQISGLTDEPILRLVTLWLKMGTVDGRGLWRDTNGGVVQGGVISPLLANLYLHPFDQSMTSRGVALVRYADDFVLLSTERQQAETALPAAQTFLQERLKLRLNDGAAVAAIRDGFDFLGIHFQGGAERTIATAKISGAGEGLARALSRHRDNPALAIEATRETVSGWRRYYGSIVSPDELSRLEEVLRAQLVTFIRTAMAPGTDESRRTAIKLLSSIETISGRTPSEQEAWVRALVDEAAARAPQTTSTREKTHRAEHTERQPVRRSVDAAVRGRKRQSLMRLADATQLIVNDAGAFVGKHFDRLVVRRRHKAVGEVRLNALQSVTIASHGVSLSSDIIHACTARHIPVIFVDGREQSVAVAASVGARASVVRRQLAAADDPKAAFDIGKRLVAGKIANQLNLVKYLHKYRKRIDSEFCQLVAQMERTVDALRVELRKLTVHSDDLGLARNQLMSVEGRAAQVYWAALGRLFRARVAFDGRERQGAKDLVNSLLNYGYAVLSARVHVALVKAELLPEVGFLHTERHENPVLAYDLMEEFRPQVVDRTVVTMIDRREPLTQQEDGMLSDETRRRLLQRLHARLATVVRQANQELSLADLIDVQAKRLAKHVLGEGPYRPFVARW